MTWVLQLGRFHLVNQSATPVAGGDPRYWYTTPFSVLEGFAAVAAKPKTTYAGSGPFANGSTPLYASYSNVEQTIPIGIEGTDADNTAQLLQLLKTELSTASYSEPCIWHSRAGGAANDVYAEIYEATVQERTDNGEIGPAEGGAQIEADIHLVRSPFFGAAELVELLSAIEYTNGPTSNLVALGDLFGDLVYEGQPLNIQIDKPTSQSAASVLLATVHQVLSASLAEAKTCASSSVATAYSLTSALDASALLTRKRLSLRTIARFTTLTAPDKALARATIQTAAGATLWVGDWVQFGSDTTAQLIDLGETPLSALRYFSVSSISIKVLVELLSSDGTSVTATLDYLELLLAYDVCSVECSGGLAAGEHYDLAGAARSTGGGFLPLMPEGAAGLNASDVATKVARIRGGLVRAYKDSSLYVAWYDSGRAHTKTDTTTISAQMAPLWRTLRGLS